MRIIRLAALLTILAGAFASSAATKLLPGSINFNDPVLWGTTVQWRSNDQGTLGGESFWYFGLSTESSEIHQYEGTATGYLSAFAANGIHRTLDAVTDKEGPAESAGRYITAEGIFLDSELTLPAFRRNYDGTPRQPNVDMTKDKLVLWTYSDSLDGSAVATLTVAAGGFTEDGELVRTNIVTDLSGFVSGVQVRLTINAKSGVDLGSGFVGYGFEIWVNDVPVTYDGGRKTLFPSLQQEFAGEAAGKLRAPKVYSLGFMGHGVVDKINFTQINPIENPDYDKDDVSMLQECAEITVDGAPAEALYNFPILVRISESRIPGFLYARARSNGADIRFTDSNGMIVPHEIDTWNDANGESFVWVKPAMVQQGTKLTMHWNIATGGVLPAVNAYDVWSEYIAVWHMNPVGSSVKDSTGNGHTATVLGDAKLGTMIGNGIVGRASSLGFIDGKHALECASFASDLDASGAFTFSGRYIGNDYQLDRFGETYGYTLYGTKGTNAVKKTVGWGGFYMAETTHRYYHDETAYIEDKKLPSLVSNWYTTAFVYDEQKTSTAYFNGAVGSSGTLTLTETYDTFRVMADGLSADEVRVSRKVLSPLWLATEDAQMTDDSFVSFAAAQPKGSVNYWVEEPSISPTSWSPDEADKVVLKMGQARFGSVVVTYSDSKGVVSAEFPTAPGVYKATFTAGDGVVHRRLTKTFNLVIYEKLAYRQIAGYDRVMLFNSDLTPGSTVTLQGFWDVDSKTNLVWSHTYETWGGTSPYVQDGAFHTYLEPETGKTLWQFRHARIGNLFPSDDVGIVAGQNMLPWNAAYGRRYDDSEKPANRQRYAGWLILQNVSGDDPAGAYSPIYSNGVGTVYFDIVNAYTAYSNSVKVQMCHKEAGARVQDGFWADVPVSVMKVVDGAYSGETESATEIGLSMKASSTNSFYRVRAKIDTTEPTRFRIVRTDSAWGTGGVDGPGLVVIDNIIASGPAMGVNVEQYGAPAIAGDAAFRGWRAPFTVPFPTVADLGTLKAAAKVTYIVNGTNTADASFIGSLIMRYRWRYLNQAADDWKDVVLRQEGDDITRFVSTDPLEGQGMGDIEYAFSAIVNAPYYDYVDYSGLGLAWQDGYTERRGDIEIDAEKDGVYSESNLSPALGTDYFIRLREGASTYERYVLRVRRNGAVESVPMSIVSDGIWRGYWLMPTNWEGTVEWQMEGDNPQIAGIGDYQWSTNYFCGSKDAEELPLNDVMVEGTADTWTKVPSDAITGYLLFQIDESTRALTIIHADYQNFNAWSDANLEDGDANGHFVGTSTADDAKAGVSRMAKNFVDDFSNLSPTVPTNSVLWEEHFDVIPIGKYEVEIPFSTTTTPNGWAADNGMWMPQEYLDTSVATSIALQLEGEGRGRLRFALPSSTCPRGLASFNYRARVSQTYDIFSFDYYRGTNDFYNLCDYTFAVPCVMRHGTHGDFEGLGSISAVAYYDDGKGCYEARVDRTAIDKVRISIYKWYVSGAQIVSELLAESEEWDYRLTGLDGESGCSALVISCENWEEVDQTRIQAGILSEMITRADVANQVLSGKSYYPVIAIDESENRHTSGTVGVGSKNCPASFSAPQLYRKTVEWSDSVSRRKMVFDTAPSIKQRLLPDEESFDDWTIRQGRLEAKSQIEEPQGWGFTAVPPTQKLIVEVAPKSTGVYRTLTEDTVDTFGFQMFTNMLYVAEDVDVRVATGGTRGDGSCDVTVDDFEAVQWRGNSYDDGENRIVYNNISRGAPTNFVYTTAWVDDLHRIELSPMRTLVDDPASIRSPLMDGASGRGLGLGMLALSYRDADSHARLIVQIATNGVDVTTLSDYTKRFEGWTNVKTIDFSTFSDEERRSGLVTCYLGLHGVKGVLRVVVDPTLVTDARDTNINPDNDPNFGCVYVTDISVRDNPLLDSGCWWGWNLRTTDDPSFQLLDDGAHETGAWGLSFALNNSIRDDVRPEDKDAYPKHPPFLQTPVFSRGAVGQISFKARKYSATDPSPTVAVYASTGLGTLTDDKDFEYVGEVVVDSDRFERYDFTASITKSYTGFRLVITGVAGVDNPGEAPASGYVERVLIDEVAVFESIRARMGFRNVGAFRSSLTSTDPVANVPSAEEQPLCNEAFGIQTELYVAQLASTIDTSREPEVYLHWYADYAPWGYSRWASKGTTTRLRRVGDDSKWIFRSTYADGDGGVIPAQSNPAQIVQYSLDVVFYMKGSDDPITNTLSSSEWSVPEWFNPIDYNLSLGKGRSEYFSAFTILDSIAPGWAWINEVNVYGDYVNYSNTDATRQYIEIAAPVEADMTGWYVQMLSPNSSSGSIYTNKLAVFGTISLDAKKKTDAKGQAYGQASNMVFRVIANKGTRDAGELKTSDGTLDGVWSVQNPCSAMNSDGVISYYQGFGLQLVRPSGAVEHEIVAIGTNKYATSANRSYYHPTNVVNFLNARMRSADFFHAGDDDGGKPNSLGVFTSHGETKECWTNSLEWTPGRINIGQSINPDHPTPSGESILVYATLGSDHIHQSVDSVLIVRKGSDVGTNIFYTVDRWYQLGSVTTNGVTVEAEAAVDPHTYVLNVGRGCSNNVTVIASAVIDNRLRELGCDENNAYTPAIMKWLEEAMDIDGNEWPDGDTIYLADHVGIDGSVITNLTLTQMYWLDMCPTITNQCLIAGMADPPTTSIKPPKYAGGEERTNLTMTVLMLMSNRTEDVSSPYYGRAWKPTVLRGLEPGSNSRDYSTATVPWTNETFKIAGILANGYTSEDNERNWIPVRFFVFDENSFTTGGKAEITVDDPHSSASPGYAAGWGEWFRKYPGDKSPIFFKWAIDTRLMPITVELLRPKNPLN